MFGDPDHDHHAQLDGAVGGGTKLGMCRSLDYLAREAQQSHVRSNTCLVAADELTCPWFRITITSGR